jgi:hypothetical protein
VERRREEITVHGRRFALIIEGPDDARRYSAHVREAEAGRPLTRNPVRGRSADDARDRALEVMHNLLGIARVHDAIVAAAAEFAPGATVTLTEDAHGIRAELEGTWSLDTPLTIPRDVVADPDADLDDVRLKILEHFHAHLRASTRDAG